MSISHVVAALRSVEADLDRFADVLRQAARQGDYPNLRRQVFEHRRLAAVIAHAAKEIAELEGPPPDTCPVQFFLFSDLAAFFEKSGIPKPEN